MSNNHHGEEDYLLPFYSRDGITIYHGDCRQIIPRLPPVNLVVTDPPYGMQFQSGTRYEKLDKIHGDDEMPVDVLEECLAIASHGVYWCCRWDNLGQIPPPKSFVAWVKNHFTHGDLNHSHGRQWEGVAFYPGEEHKFKKRIPDVIDARRIEPEFNHPTQKPVVVMKELIAANEGNVVLDPFMGTGSTLLAARDLGRKAIGIEYEYKWCQVAADRLSQGTLFNCREKYVKPQPEQQPGLF